MVDSVNAADSLERTVVEQRRFLADASPELVTTARAAELLEVFSEIEQIGAAGKLLFASRAAESTTWAAQGHRSPASWLAAKHKCSFGEAMAAFETSKRLANLDETKQALRSGDVSASQAKEIALAAEKDPSSEASLIDGAAEESLKSLKHRVRQVLARASSEQEEIDRYNRVRASRYLNHWSDYDGAVRIDAKLAPDAGARVVSAIDEEYKTIFEAKRAEGEREDPRAYRADALVAMVCSSSPAEGSVVATSSGSESSVGSSVGTRAGGRSDAVAIRVDAEALRRGYATGEELCEIAGVGQVPVATARRLLSEAFVKIVIRDAVDVLSVCHLGRMVPAHLKTALEERDPHCVVPGCDVASGLEIHHWREGYAKSKSASLDSLCRLCARHHDLISYQGFELDGGPGKWRLVRPPPPRVLDSA